MKLTTKQKDGLVMLAACHRRGVTVKYSNQTVAPGDGVTASLYWQTANGLAQHGLAELVRETVEITEAGLEMAERL